MSDRQTPSFPGASLAASARMSVFKGAIYRSGDPSLPLIVAIFRSGELVAFRKVSSLEEGEALIERAVTLLPLLRDDLPEA